MPAEHGSIVPGDAQYDPFGQGDSMLLPAGQKLPPSKHGMPFEAVPSGQYVPGIEHVTQASTLDSPSFELKVPAWQKLAEAGVVQ